MLPFEASKVIGFSPTDVWARMATTACWQDLLDVYVGKKGRHVVALDGSISGEHGIGFAKAPYISIELSPEAIALMKRVKTAFDPNGILNPGKIFP